MAGRPPGASADGRVRLLDACWELLLENQPGERLTIASVCARARCTPPTLYHHFGDLSSLETAASTRAFETWSAAVKEEHADVTDHKERLRKYALAYLAWAMEHPDAYTSLYGRPGQLGPDGGDGPRFNLLTDTLAEMHGTTPQDGRVMAVSFALWCALHGAATLAIAAPSLPPEAAEETLWYIGDAVNAFGLPDPGPWASELAVALSDPDPQRPRPRRFRY